MEMKRFKNLITFSMAVVLFIILVIYNKGLTNLIPADINKAQAVIDINVAAGFKNGMLLCGFIFIALCVIRFVVLVFIYRKIDLMSLPMILLFVNDIFYFSKSSISLEVYKNAKSFTFTTVLLFIALILYFTYRVKIFGLSKILNIFGIGKR